jgi:FdrA protein
VNTSNEEVVRYVGSILQALNAVETDEKPAATPVDLAVLKKPLEAINVGLESFYENLKLQGVPVLHLDWRPAAGGNEKLIGILERLKQYE